MDYKNDSSVIERNFLGRIREIRKMFGEHAIARALEIGCAYGFFARQFTATFKRARYYGIDIAKEAVTYAKMNLQQNCENTDYLILPPPQTPYSDVFLWDVIEHLPNPSGVIEKISREIALGGRIHITTGDIDSLVARFQKARWRLIHPPTHLSYFSAKTLTMFLRKHGFRVKSISYPPVWRSVRQIFYSLFILNKKDNITLGKLHLWIPKHLCVPINTFDIMYMVAERTCDMDGE
ncbi:MAG: class I SAM-dependent methyltransferase [Kiritimatiellae bacterium]|nr:class I SAM-dependent methyltransferase [Kiritimatiellia bacterium]